MYAVKCAAPLSPFESMILSQCAKVLSWLKGDENELIPEWTELAPFREEKHFYCRSFLLGLTRSKASPGLKKKKLRGEKSQRKSVIGENDQRLGAPGKVSRAGQPRALGDAAHQNPGRACLACVPRGFDPAITDRPTQLRGCLISGTCGRVF